MRLQSPFPISAKRAGAFTLVAALASLAACGADKPSALDESLKADLAAAGAHSDATFELAPSSARSLTVVSAIEGGPKAGPTRAATARAPKPVTQVKRQAPARETAVPRTASSEAPTSAPREPAPAEADAPAISAPRPSPSATQQQDRRVYKTEAEIFRQMPWIRP